MKYISLRVQNILVGTIDFNNSNAVGLHFTQIFHRRKNHNLPHTLTHITHSISMEVLVETWAHHAYEHFMFTVRIRNVFHSRLRATSERS